MTLGQGGGGPGVSDACSRGTSGRVFNEPGIERIYTSTVQQKYNASHMCNLKSSRSHKREI